MVRPGALSEEATGELMGAVLTTEVDATFRVALHEASGGNPLSYASSRTRSPNRDSASRHPTSPASETWAGTAVSRAVSLRLSRLPAAATSLAHAVAIFGDEADLVSPLRSRV